MKNPGNRNGFTLLEVVLGLAISAVILALILGAIRLSTRSQEKGMTRQEQTQRVRILYDRLGWIVRGAYPYVSLDPEDPENIELFFSGTESSLGFVTTSTDPYSEGPIDASGLKYVNLSISDGLVFTERVFFQGEDDEAEETRYVLDTNVKRLEFSYLDQNRDEETGEEGEQEWIDEWDGTEKNYLPKAVRIRVLMKFGDQEKWMPPVIAMIRASGNSFMPGPTGTSPQQTGMPLQPLQMPQR